MQPYGAASLQALIRRAVVHGEGVDHVVALPTLAVLSAVFRCDHGLAMATTLSASVHRCRRNGDRCHGE